MTEKNILSLEAQILNGETVYFDPKFKEKTREFKQLHEGGFVNIVIEAHSAVAYFQHKYFHGFVLPQICEAMGEKDESYVKEFVLKQEMLFRAVESVKEIPVRHRRKCRTVSVEYKEPESDKIKNKIIGYVPSTTTLDFKEMRDFIKWCEAIRDGMIDWSILKRNKKEYEEMVRLRALAMSETFDKLSGGESK